ncbi:MAG: hypothetical protein IJK05_02345 [Bacteroidales bacterium]|nr:hypothetical protein [Bacteroidales bacterium]
MPRKLAILPLLMSMLMVLFTTMVPHHHHQAMICLAREVCELDGSTRDSHEANHEEEESHCVSTEKYCPISFQKLDITPLSSPTPALPLPVVKAVTLGFVESYSDIPLHIPPLLSWRINR